MSTDIKLKVTEIQRFCMHDGPGVRTTVFLKGCPLHCAWCHNPETQRRQSEMLFYKSKCIGCRACESVCESGAHSFGDCHEYERSKCSFCFACADECPTRALEACGREYTAEELISIIEKDKAFYGDAGGMTLSGGEPLLQGEGAVMLLRACRERGISTAVETCGYADVSVLLSAIPHVDLFLWDVKDTDDCRHERYTGVSNKRILENLALADANGAKTRLRCILVNGVNTNEEHYRAVAEIASSLANCEGVEWIPYHAYGGTKATFLGFEDNGRVEWIPDPEQLEQARNALDSRGIRAF